MASSMPMPWSLTLKRTVVLAAVRSSGSMARVMAPCCENLTAFDNNTPSTRSMRLRSPLKAAGKRSSLATLNCRPRSSAMVP